MSAIRRLSLRVDIPSLIRVAKADHFGRTTPDALQRQFPAGTWLLEMSKKLDVIEQKPKPYLTGKFLLSQGMLPGVKMGEIIQESFELQLDGELATLEDTQEWVKQKYINCL